MWAAAAQFGLQAVMGISQGITDRANINAANTVNEANSFANNLIRGANNQLGAARGSLNRYNQSVNNQRTLQSAGMQAEAALVNYRRARDSEIQDDFETQLRFAEQAGAQAAATALSGLSGGVADVVNSTTALRKSRLLQRSETARKQGDFDAQQRQAQILQAGWDSLDNSEITDNIDYSKDVAVKRFASGNLFTQIMGVQDMKNMANLASNAVKFL